MGNGKSNTENNKIIAKNTLALYFRQIITMFVSLFTTRIILEQLGVEDFGIKNVVGGVVAMLSFLTSSLASTTQRFLSVEMGKGDFAKLKQIFSNSLSLHVIFIVLAVVLAQTVGLWFLQNKLVIPLERANAAFWVYQFSVISFVVAVFFAPFDGAIRAHEKFSFYAKLSIFDVVAKLIAVYLLVVLPFDKLVALSGLWLCVVVLGKLVLYIYCRRNFEECQIRFAWARESVRSLMGFGAYKMIDSFSTMVKHQGLNIILNLYYGPILNAAQGIASTVNNAFTQFYRDLLSAASPQMVMSYAQKNNARLLNLVTMSSRFCFYLILILTLPFILETDTALLFWLGNYPEYATVFTKLFLIDALFHTLWMPIFQSGHAVGKLRANTINLFVCRLITLVVAVLIGKNNLSPTYIYISLLVLQGFCFFINLIIVWKIQLNFSLRKYFIDVILPISKTTFFVVSLPVILHYFFSKSVFSSVIIGSFTVVWTAITIYFIGIDKNERFMILAFVKQKILRKGLL